jgi:hypothetical protein
MQKVTRAFVSGACLALAMASLTSCGGNAQRSIVAQVGSTAITRVELSHWMSTLAGGDFYEISHNHQVPAGLVSDPPNYGACVAHLEAAAAHAGTASRANAAQLLSKCRQLNQALRQQATGFLVEADWIIGLARDEGVTASKGEIDELFSRVKAQEFPTAARLRQFLSSHRRTLADERFVIELDVLRERLAQKLTAGGRQMLVKLTEDGQRWSAKTNCRPGYVVAHCRQFTGATSSGPSPAVLLEQVATITGVQCVNRRACA